MAPSIVLIWNCSVLLDHAAAVSEALENNPTYWGSKATTRRRRRSGARKKKKPEEPQVFSGTLFFFRDSSRLLILSLAGSRLRFLRLLIPATPVGNRREESPHGEGAPSGPVALGWLLFLLFSSCQEHSWHKATKRSSWVALTFLLTLRELSNGFWMCSGDTSGLFCSRPWRRTRIV